jgi:hypothetical protein
MQSFSPVACAWRGFVFAQPSQVAAPSQVPCEFTDYIDQQLIDIMAKTSGYQDRIIRRYYENKDAIMLQKLGDLVSDLYLAEGKAKDRLWKRLAAALTNLKIPDEQIQRLVRSDNPALAANLLKKLLEKK